MAGRMAHVTRRETPSQADERVATPPACRMTGSRSLPDVPRSNAEPSPAGYAGVQADAGAARTSPTPIGASSRVSRSTAASVERGSGQTRPSFEVGQVGAMGDGADQMRRATSGVYLLALGIGLAGHSGAAVVAALASYAAAHLFIARQHRGATTVAQYRVLADRACRRGRFAIARDYYQRALLLAQTPAHPPLAPESIEVDRYQLAAVDAMLGDYAQAGVVLEAMFCSSAALGPNAADARGSGPHRSAAGEHRCAGPDEARPGDRASVSTTRSVINGAASPQGDARPVYAHSSWLLRYVAYHLARRGDRARAHRLAFAALAIEDADELREVAHSEYAWLALTVGEYEAAADAFVRLLDGPRHNRTSAAMGTMRGPNAGSRHTSAPRVGFSGSEHQNSPPSAAWSPYRVRSTQAPTTWRERGGGVLTSDAPELGLALALRRVGDLARARVMLEDLRVSCGSASPELRGTVLRELGEVELAIGDLGYARELLHAAAASDVHADRRSGGLALDHVALARVELRDANFDRLEEQLSLARAALSRGPSAAAACVEQLAAFVSMCEREPEDAVRHCDAALAAASRTCGNDHRDHAWTWAMRAWAQLELGHLGACDESLRVATRLLGGGRAVDALTRGTLALVRAQRLTWRAAMHGSTLVAVKGGNNAGVPEISLDELCDPESPRKRAPAAGQSSPPTGSALENLNQARKAARHALLAWERTLGPRHPALYAPLKVLVSIANAYGHDDELHELRRRYAALLRIHRSAPAEGEQPPAA